LTRKANYFLFKRVYRVFTMANILTKKGLQELQAELKKIVEIDLPQTLSSLNTAREEGDLKENAGYQTALKVKDELTTRQQEIEEILSNYELIDETKKPTKGVKTASIGSTIKVVYLDSDTEYTLTIVGSSESNILDDKISNESPLANAILGKKVGDKVTFKTPKGRLEVKLLEIK
jgi:transcription elongation factor GreA